MPAAPPTFSTITCCPSASDMPTEMIRAAVSLELPAANGTTMVTGRVGQLCADAVANGDQRRDGSERAEHDADGIGHDRFS